MKRFWGWISGIIALVLITAVISSVPLAETMMAIRRVETGQWLLLIWLNVEVLVLLNGRWWLVLRGLGVTVPFWSLLGYRLAGFGVSYFTPGPQFGGEPLQVLLLEKEQKVRRQTAVASVALDKTLELLVNFAFLAGGVLFVVQQGILGGELGWQTAVLGVLLLLVPLGLLGALWWGKRPLSESLNWLLWVGGKLSIINGNPDEHQTLHKYSLIVNVAGRDASACQSKIVNSVADAETQMTHALQTAPAWIWAAFGLALLSWVGMVVEYGLTLRYLGLELTPPQVLLLLVAARLAILLPIPAGVGTLESSQVVGLHLLGLETAVGLSISLVIRARDVLVGGLGLLWGWWKIRPYLYSDQKMTT